MALVAGLLLAGLLLATVAWAADNSLRFALFSPPLDIAVNTVGSGVSAAVAMLGFARYREGGGTPTLLLAASFVVLAVANLSDLVAVISGWDAALGLSLGDPGQLPLYGWAIARLVSAGLLVAGAFDATATRRIWTRRPLLTLVLPSVALTIGCAGLWLVQAHLPTLIDPATLGSLASEAFSSTPLPGVNVGLLLVDGGAGLLLAVAAAGYLRRTSNPGIPRRYLVLGLVFAAFSQLHFVLYPAAVYTSIVSTGDALRIAFYIVLVAGVIAASRADLQALRSANGRLELLASATADHAAIAERARLARELHDGLAQNLWTAKLEFDRLATQVDIEGSPAVGQVERVRAALDAARLEAREAVTTLRSGFDAGLSLSDELPRRLEAFIDRTGYAVDLELDPRAPAVPGVVAGEVLHVVDEALHNVEKHADATLVRVRLTADGGGLLVTVEDNGQGFNPEATTEGHGLTGMRERATLLGGRLVIRSGPGDGTAVQLFLPAGVAS